MGTRDKRVDAYIARAAEFAQPILGHLRNLVHENCPSATETIKWGMPFFEHDGVLCHMASFKAHCGFGFWHEEMRSLTKDASGSEAAMGQFGRITSLRDLPTDAKMKALIRKAAALNETGVKPARVTKAKPKGPPEVPDDLATALRKNRKALANFTAMSGSHQREYTEWLTGAKREETRAKRLATAIDWIAQGKSKEWKYRA